MRMRTICCVCHRTKGANGWVKQFISQNKTISHGYCPQCFQVTMKKIQDEIFQDRGRMS